MKFSKDDIAEVRSIAGSANNECSLVRVLDVYSSDSYGESVRVRFLDGRHEHYFYADELELVKSNDRFKDLLL
jgi:hypothetical protein